MGATVNRLDLAPGERASSRTVVTRLAYLGTTPLTGNEAAIAALKKSDLVLDLMTLLFSPEQAEILAAARRSCLPSNHRKCWCGYCRPLLTNASRAAAALISAPRRCASLPEPARNCACQSASFPSFGVWFRRRTGALGSLAKRLWPDVPERGAGIRAYRARSRRYSPANEVLSQRRDPMTVEKGYVTVNRRRCRRGFAERLHGFVRRP